MKWAINVTDQNAQAREKLMSDLKQVIHDAEELLQNADHRMDDNYRSAKAKLESTLKDVQGGLYQMEGSLIDKARHTARSTDRYVQNHPWQSVGIGALAGILLGFLLGRR